MIIFFIYFFRGAKKINKKDKLTACENSSEESKNKNKKIKLSLIRPVKLQQ
jgi:hypothetical protein